MRVNSLVAYSIERAILRDVINPSGNVAETVHTTERNAGGLPIVRVLLQVNTRREPLVNAGKHSLIALRSELANQYQTLCSLGNTKHILDNEPNLFPCVVLRVQSAQ